MARQDKTLALEARSPAKHHRAKSKSVSRQSQALAMARQDKTLVLEARRPAKHHRAATKACPAKAKR
ncbi:hypothetical protein [Paenibacillus thalictri]|uniref:hypothetical protein n=1 Tax=Paenibacillus thalictri TaxID=2527873 RepID=UPI0010353509|nr:hypothetical protein [Paenibacillus thalictri]